MALRSPRVSGGDARYLSVEERTVLITRHHIAQLWRPGLVAFIALLAALLLSPTAGSSGVSNAAWLVALALLLRLGWRVLLWYNDTLVVTDKRIFEISGILTRNVASMPLRMLTDVTYQRPLGGRILGYGTLVVESAGQDQALSRIEYLPEPDNFYQTVTTLVFQ
jgi:uncharacterized membrane protein YdbT with pleckstrin-like domain